MIIEKVRKKFELHERRTTYQLDMVLVHQLRSDSKSLSDIHSYRFAMIRTGNSSLVNNGTSALHARDKGNSSQQYSCCSVPKSIFLRQD